MDSLSGFELSFHICCLWCQNQLCFCFSLGTTISVCPFALNLNLALVFLFASTFLNFSPLCLFSCFPSSSCPRFLHLCSWNLLLFFSSFLHQRIQALLPLISLQWRPYPSCWSLCFLVGRKIVETRQLSINRYAPSVSSGFKLVFCSPSYQGFKVSMHHCSLNLNIPSAHQQLVLFFLLPWKQSVCRWHTNN